MKSTFRWHKLLVLILFLYEVIDAAFPGGEDCLNPRRNGFCEALRKCRQEKGVEKCGVRETPRLCCEEDDPPRTTKKPPTGPSDQSFPDAAFPGGEDCLDPRRNGFCEALRKCRREKGVAKCGVRQTPRLCCEEAELENAPVSQISTTTSKPRTTKKPPTGPIDLSFPNCGLRSPKVAGLNRGRQTGGFGRKKRGLASGTGSSLKDIFNKFFPSNGNNANPVIVGGVTVRPNSWPWQVALFAKRSRYCLPEEPECLICGGSLISKRYILTAAHCFNEENGNITLSKWTVVVGAHIVPLIGTDGAQGTDGTVYALEDVIIHPDFKIGQYYNDLALLKVAKEVVLGKKVWPVCLISPGVRNKLRPAVKTVNVTGWGDIRYRGPRSETLREVNVPLVPVKECNQSYYSFRKQVPEGITDLFLCAGMPEGGKDSCQSDSGGPMVVKSKDDDSYIQLGSVSFGYECARGDHPGVYVRLSKFTRWLYDNTDLG